MTGSMRAVTQTAYGGPDRLVLSIVERPEPDPTDVLVEVRAAAVSPGDRAMITGVPYVNRLAARSLRHPPQLIPGFDCAGVVEAIGTEVEGFEVGDAVFGNAAGSFAEYAVASQDQLAPIPDGWTFDDAATIPESGCVALQAICDRGRVEAGQHVAIVGAGGGVGSCAVQIAKATGAHVTGVCGTRMLDGVRALGADDVVDYTTAELADSGQAYDVIVDTAGATPLRRLRSALSESGTLVLVGADHAHCVTGGLGRWMRAVLWSPMVSQRLRPFVARPLSREHLDQLVELMAQGRLQGCVDRTFRLEEAADAVRHLDHRDRPGKVVVVTQPT
jgi:NADPH:quinone reductase-like Zn-dependent oxidoreductase